ncbi:hypothetical protein GmHk_09G024845 [Glycine max]|nr:hypothetical protein GmHk_09G024845 [Glycine max]
MWIQWWLKTCSSANCATVTHYSTISLPKQKQHACDDSIMYSSISEAPSSTTLNNNTSSLESNLFIQTLSSIPTLQNLSPQTFTFFVSHHCVTTLTPHPFHVTSLAVNNNLLYTTTVHEINVYDHHRCTTLHTFNTQPTSNSTKTITFNNNNNTVITTHQNCKIHVWQNHKNHHHHMLATLPTINDCLRRFLLPKNNVAIPIMISGSRACGCGHEAHR